MSVYKELDANLIWHLIEGYQDELTPEAKTLDAFYRQFRCPRCKEQLTKEFDARTTFSGGDLIGHALLRCLSCRYLVEPHTQIVIESGSPAKMPIEFIPFINPEK
jgi:hypothetical protein